MREAAAVVTVEDAVVAAAGSAEAVGAAADGETVVMEDTGTKKDLVQYCCFTKVHWNPSIVDFFVKAKLSTIEGFSTNEGVLCGEKSICQA